MGKNRCFYEDFILVVCVIQGFEWKWLLYGLEERLEERLFIKGLVVKVQARGWEKRCSGDYYLGIRMEEGGIVGWILRGEIRRGNDLWLRDLVLSR